MLRQLKIFRLTLQYFQIQRTYESIVLIILHNSISDISQTTNQFSAPRNFSTVQSPHALYVTAFHIGIYILHSLFRLSLSLRSYAHQRVYIIYATFHSHHSRIIFSPRIRTCAHSVAELFERLIREDKPYSAAAGKSRAAAGENLGDGVVCVYVYSSHRNSSLSLCIYNRQ